MEQLSCGWNEVAASIELSEGGEVLWGEEGDREEKGRFKVASVPGSSPKKCGKRGQEFG